MAIIEQTDQPILQSQAQLLVLPVNSEGSLLHPILARCKTLFPDNYQAYYRQCLDGTLTVGDCLLIKRQKEHFGLSSTSNRNQPTYIANLIVTDSAHHPTHKAWLIKSLQNLYQATYQLIRYQGLRRIAILTHPLTLNNHYQDTQTLTPVTSSKILNWHDDILPIITQILSSLPSVRIDCHLPKQTPIDHIKPQ